MKKIQIFTCGKMAWRLILAIVVAFAMPIVFLWVSDDIFLRIVIAIFSVLGIFFVILTNGYGFSILRCLIPVKIDSEGISNCFCSIKWEEIKGMQFERVKIEKIMRTKSIIITNGEYGVVLIVHKNESDVPSEENTNIKTFKNYSLKNSICVPVSIKTLQKISQIFPENNEFKEAYRELI